MSKNKNSISSRKQIQLKEVRDGILILPNDRYRMILETSSVNFELKSDEEQDVLLESFQNFLNSLPCPLQILIRVREIDVDSYIEQVTKSKESETETVYQEQIDNYANFIRQIVSGNKILTRKFYIIIPYTHLERKKDFAIIKEHLYLQRDLVHRGIEKIGMKARSLDTLEVLNLFYSFYNTQQAKTQELTKHSLKILLEDTYV
ncbi:MAG TPA: hypothetical protein VNW29_05565 [Candidatus Sulfotelmatobacter sp.]|nr:hypothetical protein [Candidatus Sulfotelmatobacter sp.]